MANYIYIACSLDGFIAKPDGNLDWLTGIPNEENDDYGFSKFLQKIDGIVMGRNTFETVLRFKDWPYNKPVFVLSNTLEHIPESLKGKAEIVNGKLEGILRSLNERNIKNFYIDGGRTIQSFLKEDLIDEMIITTISKIIGGGISLFGSIDRDLDFKVVRSEILNDFMVKNYYKRGKSK